MKIKIELPGDREILGYNTERLEANIEQHYLDIEELRRCIGGHEDHINVLKNIIVRKEVLERGRDSSDGPVCES